MPRTRAGGVPEKSRSAGGSALSRGWRGGGQHRCSPSANTLDATTTPSGLDVPCDRCSAASRQAAERSVALVWFDRNHRTVGVEQDLLSVGPEDEFAHRRSEERRVG